MATVTIQIGSNTSTKPFESNLNVDDPNGWVSGLVLQAPDGTYNRLGARLVGTNILRVWPYPVVVNSGGGSTPTSGFQDLYLGDSLTTSTLESSVLDANSYPTKVHALLPSAWKTGTALGQGYPGQTVVQVQQQGFSYVAGLKRNNVGKIFVVIRAGINNLAVALDGVDVTFNQLVALGTACYNAGLLPLYCTTTIARGRQNGLNNGYNGITYAQLDALQYDLNNRIRTQQAALKAVGVVDLGSDSRLNTYSPTYQVDGIHETAVGREVVAGMVAQGLQAAAAGQTGFVITGQTAQAVNGVVVIEESDSRVSHPAGTGYNTTAAYPWIYPSNGVGTSSDNAGEKWDIAYNGLAWCYLALDAYSDATLGKFRVNLRSQSGAVVKTAVFDTYSATAKAAGTVLYQLDAGVRGNWKVELIHESGGAVGWDCVRLSASPLTANAGTSVTPFTVESTEFTYSGPAGGIAVLNNAAYVNDGVGTFSDTPGATLTYVSSAKLWRYADLWFYRAPGTGEVRIRVLNGTTEIVNHTLKTVSETEQYSNVAPLLVDAGGPGYLTLEIYHLDNKPIGLDCVKFR